MIFFVFRVGERRKNFYALGAPVCSEPAERVEGFIFGFGNKNDNPRAIIAASSAECRRARSGD